jgi:spore maturation protein CgeB
MSVEARAARAMVVSPVEGGSLPISRHVYEALCSLGLDVFFADLSFLAAGSPWRGLDNDDEVRSALVEHASQLVLKKARAFDPALCVVLAQAPLSPRAVETLRHEGVTTVYWFVENARLTRYWEWLAPLYDYFFTIQRGAFHDDLERVGCARDRVHWLPLACNPARHRPARLSKTDKRELTCDISFAGYGYYNRREAFAALLDLDFGIWGPGWEASRVSSLVRDDSVFDEKTFLKIAAASKINLNLHSATHIAGVDPDGDYLNPRVFELAASGAFQLTDRRSDLPSTLVEGSEIATFSHIGELRERVEYYLAHDEERARIAAAARKRVRSEHTYQRRMEAMLEVVMDEERCGFRGDRRASLEPSDLLGSAGGESINDATLARELARLESDERASDEEVLLRIALGAAGRHEERP